MEFSIKHEGLTDFTVRFRAVRNLREKIENLLDHAAFSATAYMHLHVPYHSGALSSAINYSKAQYAPGGFGGGGFYEANIGVDENIAPHARHVLYGSGLYRETDPDYIRPRRDVMVFMSHDEKVFAEYTVGQRPRREWFDDAARLANEIISQGINTL